MRAGPRDGRRVAPDFLRAAFFRDGFRAGPLERRAALFFRAADLRGPVGLPPPSREVVDLGPDGRGPRAVVAFGPEGLAPRAVEFPARGPVGGEPVPLGLRARRFAVRRAPLLRGGAARSSRPELDRAGAATGFAGTQPPHVLEQRPPFFGAKRTSLADGEPSDPKRSHPHADQPPHREPQDEEAPPDCRFLPSIRVRDREVVCESGS